VNIPVGSKDEPEREISGEICGLGGCPRIAIVARAFLIEGCFSII